MISKTSILLLSLVSCIYNFTRTINTFIHRAAFEEFANHIHDPIPDDLSYTNKPQTVDPKMVKTNDTIFVRRNALEHFFTKINNKIKNTYILVSHGDDPDFDNQYFKYLDDPKIIACFGINPGFAYHKKFIPIPIGIYQTKKIWTDKKNISYKLANFRKIPKTKILYINFTDNSHPDRVNLKKQFSNQPFCHESPRKEFLEYLEDMSHFKFALSPRGYGEDCYRTWEALLVGTIPIVKSRFP